MTDELNGQSGEYMNPPAEPSEVLLDLILELETAFYAGQFPVPSPANLTQLSQNELDEYQSIRQKLEL
ncbi:MAG: hypothetical protein FJ267_16915, partial [Planctomycetes bacterium]|nr:hypothetical protein [Planctomycetota bacterium]